MILKTNQPAHQHDRLGNLLAARAADKRRLAGGKGGAGEAEGDGLAEAEARGDGRSGAGGATAAS